MSTCFKIMFKVIFMLSLTLSLSCGVIQEEKVVNRITERNQEYSPVDISLEEKKEQSSQKIEGGYNLTFNLLTDASDGSFDVICSSNSDLSGTKFTPDSQDGMTVYVPVGLYCKIAINSFVFNSKTYSFDGDSSTTLWNADSSIKHNYTSGGETVQLVVTSNNLFEDGSTTAKKIVKNPSENYAISASLIFVTSEDSENILKAKQTSINISGEPIPDFSVSSSAGFVYDTDSWKFAVDISLNCSSTWIYSAGDASLSKCRVASTSEDVAMEDLSFHVSHTSQITNKNFDTLSNSSNFTYTDVSSSQLTSTGLSFQVSQSLGANGSAFPTNASTPAYRYLILKRGSGSFRVYEYVLSRDGQ